jgi:hypothetical protein
MWNAGVRAPRSVLVTVLVALVVVIAALVVVVAQRPRTDATVSAPVSAVPPSGQSTLECGTVSCRTLKAIDVHGTTVSLLDDGEGGSGLVTVGPQVPTVVEVTITALGVKLGPDSLLCLDGGTAACLVLGRQQGGAVVAELLSSGGDTWRASERQYLSDASYIGLDDVTGDNVPEVLVVRHECPDSTSGTAQCAAAPVLVEVFDLGGDALGCTRKYTSPSQLRGWPTVRLEKSDIRACP